MTITGLNNFHRKCENFILNRSYLEAFEALLSYDYSRKFSFDIYKEKSVYHMLLSYYSAGIADPGREKVLSDIALSLLRFNDMARIEAMRAEHSPMVYLSNVYSERGTDLGSFHVMLSSALSIQSADAETHQKTIFEYMASQPTFSVKDVEFANNIFHDAEIPVAAKAHFVAALFIGCHFSFDAAKLDLLLSLCEKGDVEVRGRAFASVFLLALRYSARLPLYKDLISRMRLLSDMPSFLDNLKAVAMQYFQCRDTERITRKMQDELIADLKKFAAASKNISAMDNQTLEDLLENPEWKKAAEQSGIDKKMREFGEIQSQGGDVFMATFSRLKNYPFFESLANWFLPFAPSHSVFNGANLPINSMIADIPMMCNSDKYSFALSLLSIPESQRSLVVSQMEGNFEQIKEMRQGLTDPEGDRFLDVVRTYIQDVYRFLRLFRYRSEFVDIFAIEPAIHSVPVFNCIMNEPDTVALIADFYFRREYYAEAAEMFDSLLAISESSSEIYEKSGYCYQMLKNYPRAIDMYEKALIFNSENVWTLRHAAVCYKISGDLDKALVLYRDAEALAPSNISLLLSIGHLLLEQGNTSEALQYYYKVDYLDDKKHRAWRPIAWAEFLLGNYDKSEAYYAKILSDNPTAQDTLNHAHLLFVQKGISAAALSYKAAAKIDGIKPLLADRKVLLDKGISPLDFTLLVDWVRFSLPLSD